MNKYIDMNLDQVINAFNQIARVVTFENDLDAVSFMVYNIQNNHINSKDIYAMEHTGFSEIQPKVITAKYQITRNDTSRLLIFLYKTDKDNHGIAVYEYPRIFDDDIETGYIFIPEKSLSPDASPEIHWFAIYRIFEKLFHYAGNNSDPNCFTKSFRDYFIEIISSIFTNVLLTSDNYKPTEISKNIIDKLSRSVIQGSYQSMEIKLDSTASSTEEIQYSKDDFRFDIVKLAKETYSDYLKKRDPDY